MNKTIHWSGCWEKREGRVICRWMVAWFSCNKKTYGAASGYSGGGCFQLERFLISENKILVEANEEIICDNEDDRFKIEFCVDKILKRHDEDSWNNSETLYLIDQKILKRGADLEIFVLGEKMPRQFLELFEAVGLITKPNKKFLLK